MRKENWNPEMDDAMQKIQELSDEELDKVGGAGNPFKDVDRVPTQPINEDLRKKA